LPQYFCGVIETENCIANAEMAARSRNLNGDNYLTETTDLKVLARALAFAAHKHRDQRRKDVEASPYINHPIALFDHLVNVGDIADTEILSAALLHDTIEDTETTHGELVEEFGAIISGIVAEVTDDKSLLKPERKLRQVEHAPHLSTRARAVKLADKTCNLKDVAESPPHHWELERRRAYFDWAKQVVDGLRGEWPVLEAAFDRQYERKPVAELESSQ
jgi:guanosine-3',5'-bis(diphosphate) 3'-pyrophosphohydrolase